MKQSRVIAGGWCWFLEAGLLLVLPLVFYRPFTEQFSTPKIVLTEWLSVAGSAFAMLGMLWHGQWPRARIGWPVALLTLAVLLSSLNSPSPAFSLDHAMYFLCGPAWLMILVWIAGNVNRVRRLTTLATVAGTLVALIALAQWLGHDPLLFGGFHVENAGMVERMRLYSTLGNPNFVAGYLVGTVPLAFGLAWGATKFAVRFFSLASTTFVCAAILGTQSHGAWAALLAAALMWLWLLRSTQVRARARLVENFRLAQPGYRTGVRSFSVLAPTLLFLATPMFAHLAARLFEQLQGRIFLWRVGWPLFAEHPLMGSGWASVQLRFLELQAQYLAVHPDQLHFWSIVSQLHNDWLQLLAETGVLGLAAFVWLIWIYASELRQALAISDTFARPLLVASAAGVTAILADAVFNFQFAVPPTLILLFTLLAFPSMVAARREIPRNYPPRRREFGLRGMAGAAVLGCAAWLMLQTERHAQAELLYAQGMRWEMAGGSGLDSGEKFYREGLALEPRNGRVRFGLSRILYLKQRYSEALAEAENAQFIDSDSHLEVLKGRILEAMNRRAEALATFQHAVALDPTLETVRADLDRLRTAAPEVERRNEKAPTQ